MAFNEETITEHLLLALAERHSGRNLEIRAYTKHQEGTGTKSTNGVPTGADWAFWFADSQNKGIELRIQAKRLFPSGKYESLDGNGQQKKDLTNNRGNAIPLYVFYNGSNKLELDNITKNFFIKNHPYCFFNWSDWGCTIASPDAIPSKNKPSPLEIKHMFPWHQLVCGNQPSLPEQVAASTKEAYKYSSDDQIVDIKYRFEANQDAPDWVDQLARQKSNEDNYPSNLDEYMLKHNLFGVVYIREVNQ